MRGILKHEGRVVVRRVYNAENVMIVWCKEDCRLKAMVLALESEFLLMESPKSRHPQHMYGTWKRKLHGRQVSRSSDLSGLLRLVATEKL